MRMDCQGKGTFFGTVANLVNSAVGAGMLSLPFAYQASGLVLGSALLCVFALLVTYSLHVIGRAQKQTNSKTYQEVARKVLGARAEAACIYGQLLFFVGVCVGFLDIIPDQLVPVLQYAHAHHGLPASLCHREVVIVGVAVCVLLPMMFIRNIARLSPLATFSVCAIFYTVGMFVARTVTVVITAVASAVTAAASRPSSSASRSLSSGPLSRTCARPCR